jgi:hypothetical protein
MTTDRPPRRTLRGVALVAVALLVLGACSRSDPGTDATGPSSSTTDTGPEASFAPSTGSTNSTSTDGTAGPGDEGGSGQGGRGCPDNGRVPPVGATDVTEVAADLDGDGRDDRVLSYRRTDGTRRVATELAAGGTAAVDAGGGELDGPVPLRVLGGAPLGGDGDTVFAVTGAGASVVVVGLFQFVECAVAGVVFQSGQAVALPVGGGITHGNGIACRDGGLVALSAVSEDGESFTTEDTRYRVDGNTLVQVGTASGTLTRSGDGGALDRYFGLDCPSLERGLAG